MQALLEVCRQRGMLTSLRHVNYGGEAVRPAAVAAMRQAAPHAELHDAYGPTEASVITTSFLCNDLWRCGVSAHRQVSHLIFVNI